MASSAIRAVEDREEGPTAGEGHKNGNGHDHEARMRVLEVQLARIDERMVAIKDNMDKSMATKTDISNLKVWILGGVLGGIAVAAAIAATVVKAFF